MWPWEGEENCIASHQCDEQSKTRCDKCREGWTSWWWEVWAIFGVSYLMEEWLCPRKISHICDEQPIVIKRNILPENLWQRARTCSSKRCNKEDILRGRVVNGWSWNKAFDNPYFVLEWGFMMKPFVSKCDWVFRLHRVTHLEKIEIWAGQGGRQYSENGDLNCGELTWIVYPYLATNQLLWKKYKIQ